MRDPDGPAILSPFRAVPTRSSKRRATASEDNAMQIDRRLLGWGVFLVLLGAIPLAIDQGWLPDDIRWWELWPLILIGIGLSVMLRRTSLDGLGGLVVAATFGLIIGGSLASSSFPGFNGGCLGSTSGTGFAAQRGSLTDPQADVTLDMGCGTVTVTTAAGSDWALSGTSDGGRVPDLEQASGRLRIATPSGSFFGDRSDWQVILPAAPTLALSTTVSGGSGRFDLAGATLDSIGATLNAGDLTLDLGSATARSLSLTVNAGSGSIQLPARSMSGSITVNAGSVSLCRSPGAAIRLRMANEFASSNDYSAQGLIRSGDTWESPDWASASQRVELTTNANAGSFSLDPQEGCK